MMLDMGLNLVNKLLNRTEPVITGSSLSKPLIKQPGDATIDDPFIEADTHESSEPLNTLEKGRGEYAEVGKPRVGQADSFSPKQASENLKSEVENSREGEAKHSRTMSVTYISNNKEEIKNETILVNNNLNNENVIINPLQRSDVKEGVKDSSEHASSNYNDENLILNKQNEGNGIREKSEFDKSASTKEHSHDTRQSSQKTKAIEKIHHRVQPVTEKKSSSSNLTKLHPSQDFNRKAPIKRVTKDPFSIEIGHLSIEIVENNEMKNITNKKKRTRVRQTSTGKPVRQRH